MEYGIISLLPPAIAIAFALKTKQTILSLFVGVWVGATILYNWNPVVGFVKTISDFIIPAIGDEWNAGLLLLVSLAGGFVHILKISGAAEAFAQIVTKKINTKKKAQTMTWASAFLFSYTEPVLILGTIMRPITDKLKVARVKLAYIIDSMGSPLASFSPISSYGPFIVGLIATQLTALGLSDNPWSLYLSMFPYNLYGMFAMLTVLFVIQTRFDIGSMYTAEKRADETGEVLGEDDRPLVQDESITLPEDYQMTLKNFLVPMITLIGTIFAVIFWSGDVVKNGLQGAFLNANIVLALCTGFIAGSAGAIFIAVTTKLKTFTVAFNEWTKGIMQLMIVPMILVMAWSIGSVTTQMEVGAYLTNVIDSFLPSVFVPALIFVIGSAIAFATGSSWGVWSIMMPIALPMAHGLELSLPIVIGAVISGGLFGDHCSPISDTTIMSSTGAACDHIEHVRTQLPYAFIVGVGTIAGFLLGGLTGNVSLSLITTAGVIASIFWFLAQRVRKHSRTVVEQGKSV